MKNLAVNCLAILSLMLLPAAVSAEEQEDPPKKYALIIGNGAYTALNALPNPENDANDIAGVLSGLDFEVDIIINGRLDEMEDAVLRLRENLLEAENAYGFFFYAGHGVQSNGENYLIPIDADIRSENFLRQRAVSVQTILDELNDAKNALNIVVLDACRDNPFSWGRSRAIESRGLARVGRQPADSIIVYATSVGDQASDGEGRNGLFTSQLLKNLGTPGLEVSEVFRRTGADVADISGRRQIPAVYNQFFGTAYLGSPPLLLPDGPAGAFTTGGPQSKPAPEDPAKYWSLGASAGTAFTVPWAIGTLHITFAPLRYSFLDVGCDFGFLSGESDTDYYSLYPFAHYAVFLPLGESSGVFAGAGAGYMMARYTFPEGDISKDILAADFIVGFNILNMLEISYTLRTNFESASNKLAAGYTYRFK